MFHFVFYIGGHYHMKRVFFACRFLSMLPKKLILIGNGQNNTKSSHLPQSHYLARSNVPMTVDKEAILSM